MPSARRQLDTDEAAASPGDGAPVSPGDGAAAYPGDGAPVSASEVDAGRFVGPVASVVAAVLVFVAATALGPVKLSTDVLIGLGFDPDRADLITALIIGGSTAVGVYLAGGIRSAAVVLGLGASAALFGTTFVRETQNAMAANGAIGAFSPIGWAETLVAFVVVGLLTVWACTTCAMPIRRELIVVGSALHIATRLRTRDRRSWARPVAAALIFCLLAVALPVAGDMFNKGADNEMISGGPARQGLVPEAMGVPSDGGLPLDRRPAIEPSASASWQLSPSAPPSATPSALPTPTTTPTPAPWTATLPTGQGRVVYWKLQAPWEGVATEEVAVYLPPGYDANPTKRYPVV